ncbi:molybdopterin molybdotransferase MoeA [Sphingosinicella rhizophila]|uniref:Molybdopterin molybdenumtransferase n=1 Tax=Sphingosinicella rhizophila TaxID=3050082 RepID=A0ABU3QBV7_9SPHN|nr:molybdopterin molybdotransferase MoeA [Sphingosinicella sp. GR2756]MDT9600890.1 molybdopterin molybdotransferase MoeA [Sphingosinicella sp. GR2756]
MIDFDEAVRLVGEIALPLGRERLAIADARGRILAEPVLARMSAPPSDVSAMDGYAVRETDLDLFPAALKVIGESFPAGGCEARLNAGEAVRIFTGAPIPEGADRVVMQENVHREGALAIIDEAPGPGRHIRGRGSDFKEGDILLEPGRPMDARALVAAAAADVAEVAVWRQPRLFVLSTGDELVDPGQARDGSGTIPESVSFGVAALALDWGATFVGKRRLRDELPTMERIAGEALASADILVVTGGASVGEKDYAKQMFAPYGLDLIFSKVAIKPGKPVWLGRAGRTIVIGLPGNPGSALVTARLLLAPLLAGLSGRPPASALRWRPAPLAAAIGPCGARETFARARWLNGMAVPLSNQDSSAQKMLAMADILVRRRACAPARDAGEMVDVLDF